MGDKLDEKIAALMQEVQDGAEASGLPHGLPVLGKEDVLDRRVVFTPLYAQINESLRAFFMANTSKGVPGVTTEVVDVAKEVSSRYLLDIGGQFTQGGEDVVYLYRRTEGGVRMWHTFREAHWFSRLRCLMKTLSYRVHQRELVSAEHRAIRALRRKITPAQYATYMLANTFVEASKKSGIWYCFRKGMPVIAWRRADEVERGVHVFGSLCMHPIGYYADSWAGVMAPTDEVIAQLMMVRGDEYSFWKKAHVHRPNDPMGGI